MEKTEAGLTWGEEQPSDTSPGRTKPRCILGVRRETPSWQRASQDGGSEERHARKYRPRGHRKTNWGPRSCGKARKRRTGVRGPRTGGSERRDSKGLRPKGRRIRSETSAMSPKLQARLVAESGTLGSRGVEAAAQRPFPGLFRPDGGGGRLLDVLQQKMTMTSEQ